MKAENINLVTSRGYAFDTETHLIQPGLLGPPMVCASVANSHGGQILTKTQAMEVFKSIVATEIIIGANIAYDMLVMAMHAARLGEDLMPLIFRAYDEDRVYDIQIAEQLHALAEGHLGNDPRTGMPLRSPSTGKPAHYSLEVCCDLVLGRKTAKVNDKWRLRYALLDGVPMDQWEPEALTYPVDDAINTYEVSVAQVPRNRNLHDLSRQCYAAWALHLGAAWGFQVDPLEIAKVKAATQAAKDKGQEQFLDVGLLKRVKEKGEILIKKDTTAFKTAIADAYGCTGVCYVCDGLGKVPGSSKCVKKCPGAGCQRCLGFGYKPVGCKACDRTGYDIDSVPMPRTEKGAIGGGRDSLYESGDETLIEFAAWGEKDKILTTYIPWLEKGIAPDGSTIPLNPRPKVLKETGRIGASTEHQLPREGGVRECIVARPGHLLISADWEGAELVGHAQSCLNIVGWSHMADALNSGIKVHDQLAAQIIGCSYEHMVANRKTDKDLGNARQAAKPPNFGFPGLMGAATLCLTQRKQGPDTPDPLNPGRKYKGLRFCLLAGGATRCGVTKVTSWKFRDIPPTCLECLKTAENIRDVWLQTWPENLPYFDHVKAVYESGEMIQHFSERVRGGMTLCATANGYFQAYIGDMMKLALCRISKESYTDKSSDLYGARLIIPIHDEAVLEAREDQASAAAKRVSAIMVATMQEMCPDMAAAANAEPALMRRMHKGAEPVYNTKGELIPWEPTA